MSAPKPITHNLDKAVEITRSDIKSYCDKRIMIMNPELRNRLSKNLINKTLIFIQGYATCLKEEMAPPVNIQEVKAVLLSEGFKYVWTKVNER